MAKKIQIYDNGTWRWVDMSTGTPDPTPQPDPTPTPDPGPSPQPEPEPEPEPEPVDTQAGLGPDSVQWHRQDYPRSYLDVQSSLGQIDTTQEFAIKYRMTVRGATHHGIAVQPYGREEWYVNLAWDRDMDASNDPSKDGDYDSSSYYCRFWWPKVRDDDTSYKFVARPFYVDSDGNYVMGSDTHTFTVRDKQPKASVADPGPHVRRVRLFG